MGRYFLTKFKISDFFGSTVAQLPFDNVLIWVDQSRENFPILTMSPTDGKMPLNYDEKNG